MHPLQVLRYQCFPCNLTEMKNLHHNELTYLIDRAIPGVTHTVIPFGTPWACSRPPAPAPAAEEEEESIQEEEEEAEDW